MKYIVFLTTLLAGIAFTTPVQARTATDDEGAPIVVGGCTLVTTQAEADATHVYTLNPTHVQRLNYLYFRLWGRNARCDELQFHVLHNTTTTRLRSWLNELAFSRYRSIGTSHLVGTTIGNNGMYLVKRNGIHKVPDLLTAFSWGLLPEDRFSIPLEQRTTFNAVVTKGAPLAFSKGPYADKIFAIWKNGDRDFSSLPARLAARMENYVNGYPKIMSSCPTSCLSSTDRNCESPFFDWSWTHLNTGYKLCPSGELLDDWRYNRVTWP